MREIKTERTKIEKIDKMIIKLLSERTKISIKIGKLKNKYKLNVRDALRETKIINMYKKLAKKYKLDDSFIEKLLRSIIAHSRKIQKQR